MSGDNEAVQQFLQQRTHFQGQDYTAVQQIYWRNQRPKRSAPTPVQSGLTTPPEADDEQMGMAEGQVDPANAPPSLMQPFSLQGEAALSVTMGALGVNINEQQAVQQWCQTTPQSNLDVFHMVKAYHEKVIRPEYYVLVCQLEAGLKTVSDNVFKLQSELAWMTAENRLAQKHACGLQLLTTGWPNALAPEDRLYTISWMISQVPKLRKFLEMRGHVCDQNAHEIHRFLNILQLEPTTVPQKEGFYSGMTMLSFKSWENRQAFLEAYGGANGVPVYKDESTPIHNHHVRVAPCSPQWQRKMEAPLRVILACLNKHSDHAATSKLTILWKTLTLLEPSKDGEYNAEVRAWARLFYQTDNDEFKGRLEIVDELEKILMSEPTEVGGDARTLWEEQWYNVMWGPQHELDLTEQTAYTKAKAEAGLTGKGLGLGKGRKHWSQAAIFSSDYSPYPFTLDMVKVDAVHFVWDEMCDKFKKESEKIGDYQLATTQGKPPVTAKGTTDHPAHTAQAGVSSQAPFVPSVPATAAAKKASAPAPGSKGRGRGGTKGS